MRFFRRGNTDEAKPTVAKMGEENKMYYCPEKKRWRIRGEEHLEEEEKEIAPPPTAAALKKDEGTETPPARAMTAPAKPASAVDMMTAAPSFHRPLNSRYQTKPDTDKSAGDGPPSGAPPMGGPPMGGPPSGGPPSGGPPAGPAASPFGPAASPSQMATNPFAPKAAVQANPFAPKGFGPAATQEANPNAPRGFGAGAAVPTNPNAPRARDPMQKRERPKPRPPAAPVASPSPFGGVPAFVPPPHMGGASDAAGGDESPEGGIRPPAQPTGLPGVLPPGVLPPGVKPPAPPVEEEREDGEVNECQDPMPAQEVVEAEGIAAEEAASLPYSQATAREEHGDDVDPEGSAMKVPQDIDPEDTGMGPEGAEVIQPVKPVAEAAHDDAQAEDPEGACTNKPEEDVEPVEPERVEPIDAEEIAKVGGEPEGEFDDWSLLDTAADAEKRAAEDAKKNEVQETNSTEEAHLGAPEDVAEQGAPEDVQNRVDADAAEEPEVVKRKSSLIKLQANARGFLVRKQMQAKVAEQLKNEGVDMAMAEEAAQAVVSDVADVSFDSSMCDEVSAAERPEDETTGLSTKRKVSLVKLQARARGYLVRKQLQGEGVDEKAAAEAAEAAVKEAEEAAVKEADSVEMSAEDTSKLVKLQANARAYLQRKDMKNKAPAAIDSTAVEDTSVNAVASSAAPAPAETIDDMGGWDDFDIDGVAGLDAPPVATEPAVDAPVAAVEEPKAPVAEDAAVISEAHPQPKVDDFDGWGEDFDVDVDGIDKPAAVTEQAEIAPVPVAAEEAVVAPAEEAVVAPAEEAVVAPAEEAVVAPAEEAVVAPAEEAVVAPAEEAVVAPTAVSANDQANLDGEETAKLIEAVEQKDADGEEIAAHSASDDDERKLREALLQAKVDELMQSAKSQTAKIADLEAKLAEQVEALAQKEAAAIDAASTTSKLEARVAEMTQTAESQAAKQADLEAKLAELTEVRSDLTGQLENWTQKVADMENRLTEAQVATGQLEEWKQKVADMENRLTEAQVTTGQLEEWKQKVADMENRLTEAQAAVSSRNGVSEGEIVRSPTPTSDELPDFVWTCGNSQVMEYVQKLLSENAALKKSSDMPDMRAVDDSFAEAVPTDFSGTTSALFDTTEVNAERALAFCSTIGDNDGHQIPPLLTLLSDHASDPQVCCKVCAALENLTFTDGDNRRAIVKNDGLEKIVAYMEQHKDAEAALLRPAVDTVWNITFEDEAVDRMADAPGTLLERFIAVLHKRMDAIELQAGCCAVLLNLAVKEQNRWKIVKLGGVAHMAAAMQQHSQCEEVLEQGCQALYMLAYHQDLRPLLQSTCGDAASLAVSYPHGARAQKWGRWLQEVLAC